jgi:hypothetical protein
MNASSFSPATALVHSPPPTRKMEVPGQNTAWNTAGAFIRRHRLWMLALVAAGMGLAGGGAWFGTAALLPLLYTLPCAAMMAMCMRGQGGSNMPATKPGGSAGTANTDPSP